MQKILLYLFVCLTSSAQAYEQNHPEIASSGGEPPSHVTPVTPGNAEESVTPSAAAPPVLLPAATNMPVGVLKKQGKSYQGQMCSCFIF